MMIMTTVIIVMMISGDGINNDDCSLDSAAGSQR